MVSPANSPSNPTQTNVLPLHIKMEVTVFHVLESLTAEFRLVQLLWDSQDEWDSLQDGWRQVKCTKHHRTVWCDPEQAYCII